MTDKATEKQAPDCKAESGLSEKLAGEAIESAKQNGANKHHHAKGEQAQGLLDQARIEIPNDCSTVLKHKPTSLEELSKASQKELTCLYHDAAAGKLPDGKTDGKAIFMPGTGIGKIFSEIDNTIWKGKVFDMKNGELVNRILGHQFIKAEVQKGPSWLDGKESIIIDYKKTSLVAGFIRDEIREVSPGLYLGVAYARLPFHHKYPALFFALDSNKKH